MEIAFILAIVAVAVPLAFVPCAISMVRKCKSHETIKTLGIGGLLFPPLWVAAMIWAFLGKPEPSAS